MSTTLKLDTTQLTELAGLLMGMAFADGDYDGEEAKTIGLTLRELLMAGEELPSEVTSYLARFDIERFDPTQACHSLMPLTLPERALVLSMISRVADADGVLDLGESEYLEAVAKTLGAKPAEYTQWTIEVLTGASPPPLPQDA